MSKEVELGTLVIVVLKARNLHDKHSFYKQDVYARVSLNGTTQNTPVDVKGGQHPVWDAEIRLSVLKGQGEKYRTLEVSCWAKENKEDDLKGTGKVDITETLKTGEFDDWVSLESSGARRGDVYLEMTYYAAALAPLTRRASKLKPSERVARPSPNTPPKTSGSSPPSYRPIPPRDLSTSPMGTHLLPPSPASSQSSSPSSSPRRREHHLPTLPEEPSSNGQPKPMPSILRPGSSPPSYRLIPPRDSSPSPMGTHLLPPSPSSSQSSSPSSSPRRREHRLPTLPEEPPSNGQPKPVPSILRPGHPQSSPIPIPRPLPSGHARHPSSSPSPDYSTFHSNRVTPGYSSTPTPAYQPEPWRTTAPSHQFSFPVPTTPPIYDPPGYNAGYARLPPRGPDWDLPDPYLASRYATPLPLPASPPRNAYVPPADNNTRPGPAHRQRAPDSSQDELRRRALRKEQEAARRQAQDEKDLALARQADRELNLGDLEAERASGSPRRNGGLGRGSADGHVMSMPGGW